jgi:Universal stress protein family
MNTKPTLVVGLDDTQTSQHALHWAVRHATKIDGQVLAVSVCTVTRIPPVSVPIRSPATGRRTTTTSTTPHGCKRRWPPSTVLHQPCQSRAWSPPGCQDRPCVPWPKPRTRYCWYSAAVAVDQSCEQCSAQSAPTAYNEPPARSP